MPISKARCVVNNLPLDVLERVFLTCVHWEHALVSPLLLAKICHHWRTVATQSARLWTDIDMSVPVKAKYFLHRSQGAGLNLSWCSPEIRKLGKSWRESFPWMCEHTDRLESLNIHWFSALDIATILSRMGDDLPRLSSLLLYASDPCGKFSLRFGGKVKVCMNMPHLRHLNLWYVASYSPCLSAMLTFLGGIQGI